MECSNINCVNTGTDRMVSCWLCVKHFHLKCSGLKARDADALADPQKSLHWTCADCKNIKVEFYNFFKNSKQEFDDICKEFLVLQAKLSKYGELFSNYSNLDKFVGSQHDVSPVRKKAFTRSAASQNMVSEPDIASPAISLALSSISPSVNELDPQLSVARRSPLLNVSTNAAVTPNSLELITPLPTISVNNKQVSEIHENFRTSNFVPSTHQGAPKPLKAIPPSKHIFVSRLASETTIEDVEFYVKSKLQMTSQISVFKFSYSRPRAITSFKVTVPDECFKYILEPNFWPASTFVREYVYNENRRNVVRLPAPSYQKN